MTKKALFVWLLSFLICHPIFSIEICRCRKQQGTSLTIYNYSVNTSEGCCSGTVAESTGTISNYFFNDDGVWELVNGDVIPGQDAQNACCNSIQT